MKNSINKIFYLGPSGSNCQHATALFLEKIDEQIMTEGTATIIKALELLNNSKENDVAILPIENSIEGIVRETLDTLVMMPEIKIQGELTIPICHSLVSKGKKEDIKTIVSISQAINQCKNYIANNFPRAELLLYTSTSGSAEYVSKQDETYGAISSELCAYLYNLNIIDKNINDAPDNKTRFVVLSKNDLFCDIKKTRTSIAFEVENSSGTLLKVLEVFKKNNLNLIFLESRPSKRVLGEYIFYADIDKGIDEIKGAMDEIKAVCKEARVLGSYHII